LALASSVAKAKISEDGKYIDEKAYWETSNSSDYGLGCINSCLFECEKYSLRLYNRHLIDILGSYFVLETSSSAGGYFFLHFYLD
jgi:hypothetical protein